MGALRTKQETPTVKMTETSISCQTCRISLRLHVIVGQTLLAIATQDIFGYVTCTEKNLIY